MQIIAQADSTPDTANTYRLDAKLNLVIQLYLVKEIVDSGQKPSNKKVSEFDQEIPQSQTADRHHEEEPQDIYICERISRSQAAYEGLEQAEVYLLCHMAIPTRKQTAQTTAWVLFDIFFAHYGFPAGLQSDKTQSFKSKVI